MSLFIFFVTFSLQLLADETCVDWFLNAGIKPNTPSCERNCSLIMVDMGTFTCPDECENLCKSNISNKLVDQLSYMKGITEGDKVVISKYPKDAITVYRAKETADGLTEKVFGKTSKNDESDAFRHFVWSALLVKELGLEKAKIFLTAHEQDSTQSKSEREMDTKNNEIGIEFATKETKDGKPLELNKIEKAGLERLRNHKLKVLSPSKKKIPEGYYSN